MASPQVENGHTDIANEIVEKLAHYRLSGEEWQCLLVVWRKTYGWKKKDDEISLSTFESMTGIKRANVVRTLKKLVSKKILGSSDIDTRHAKRYWFNKDFEQWGPVIKKDTTSINNDTPPVSILITRPVSKKIPSKETSSKETSTKEKPPISPTGELFDRFWKSYPRKVGKGAALRAWKKVREPAKTLGLILAALEWQVESEDWREKKGKYIPHPATYLNHERWQDEPVNQDPPPPQISPEFRAALEAAGCATTGR